MDQNWYHVSYSKKIIARKIGVRNNTLSECFLMLDSCYVGDCFLNINQQTDYCSFFSPPCHLWFNYYIFISVHVDRMQRTMDLTTKSCHSSTHCHQIHTSIKFECKYLGNSHAILLNWKRDSMRKSTVRQFTHLANVASFSSPSHSGIPLLMNGLLNASAGCSCFDCIESDTFMSPVQSLFLEYKWEERECVCMCVWVNEILRLIGCVDSYEELNWFRFQIISNEAWISVINLTIFYQKGNDIDSILQKKQGRVMNFPWFCYSWAIGYYSWSWKCFRRR
jgi:hypothetical protein